MFSFSTRLRNSNSLCLLINYYLIKIGVNKMSIINVIDLHKTYGRGDLKVNQNFREMVMKIP